MTEQQTSSPTYTLTVYYTNGSKKTHLPLATPPSPKLLQTLVGGYLELYSGKGEEFEDDIYCDEEAVLKAAEPNPFFPGWYGRFVRVQRNQ